MIEQTSSLQEMMRQFAALTVEKRELEERLREIGRDLAALNEPIIDAMLDEGIDYQRIRLNGQSYGISKKTSLYARPADGDMVRLCEALRTYDPETEAMVKETINLNTLSAWVREQEADGGLPEEVAPLIQITKIPQVQVRVMPK